MAVTSPASAAWNAPATSRRPPTPVWSSALVPPGRPLARRCSCSATTTSATRSSPFADVTGDSFKLAKEAAARPEAPCIIFCGVHFMAESADILTSDEQTVILPDLAAGCSMADMAAISQVEDAWDDLVEAGIAEDTVPVTYMNSSAAIKAFTGRHGGTICTSSNAKTALRWAFAQGGDGRVEGQRQGAVPARPAPGPQHAGARPRRVPRGLRGVRPAPADGRADPPSSCRMPA